MRIGPQWTNRRLLSDHRPVRDSRRIRLTTIPREGLQCWLKADDLSETHADGDAVSTWSDQSGNGNDFSQGTAADQPTFKSRILRPTVRFDGDDHLSASSVFATSAQGEIIVVARLNSGSDGAVLSSADTATDNFFFHVEMAGTGNIVRIEQKNNDTKDEVQGGDHEDNLSIISYHSDGTAYGIDVNGSSATISTQSGSDSGDWFADTPNRDNVILGALIRTGTALGFVGELSEVIIYDRELSASERNQVETYLNDKYQTF